MPFAFPSESVFAFAGILTLAVSTAEKLEDAFRLLEEAAPQEYSICGDDKGIIHVRVRLNGNAGEASGTSKPLTITQARARGAGIEVEP